MNETLRNKLDRLLENTNIYKVKINIKCKTKDGMIYTLDTDEYERAEGEGKTCLPFSEAVHSETVGRMVHITGVIEKGDGYWFSVEEAVSIKHNEITRIWAELGDLHMDELPK